MLLMKTDTESRRSGEEHRKSPLVRCDTEHIAQKVRYGILVVTFCLGEICAQPVIFIGYFNYANYMHMEVISIPGGLSKAQVASHMMTCLFLRPSVMKKNFICIFYHTPFSRFLKTLCKFVSVELSGKLSTTEC